MAPCLECLVPILQQRPAATVAGSAALGLIKECFEQDSLAPEVRRSSWPPPTSAGLAASMVDVSLPALQRRHRYPTTDRPVGGFRQPARYDGVNTATAPKQPGSLAEMTARAAPKGLAEEVQMSASDRHLPCRPDYMDAYYQESAAGAH